MKAVEFDTKLQNGIIKVPEKYLKDLADDVRVIILIQEKKKNKKSPKFEAFSANTKDFKFNRDEANER